MAANPTSIDGNLAVFNVTTTEGSVTLEAQREYTIGHDGETNAGIASSKTIYLSVGASTVADETAGDNKFKLINGRSVIVGPGVTDLRFITKTGSATFSISASSKLFGNW